MPEPVKKSRINSLDLTSSEIFKRMESNAKKLSKDVASTIVLKWTTGEIWLDMLGITDQSERKQAMKIWQSSPKWIGGGNTGYAKQAWDKRNDPDSDDLSVENMPDV